MKKHIKTNGPCMCSIFIALFFSHSVQRDLAAWINLPKPSFWSRAATTQYSTYHNHKKCQLLCYNITYCPTWTFMWMGSSFVAQINFFCFALYSHVHRFWQLFFMLTLLLMVSAVWHVSLPENVKIETVCSKWMSSVSKCSDFLTMLPTNDTVQERQLLYISKFWYILRHE